MDREWDQIVHHAERVKKVLRGLYKALPEFTEDEYDAVLKPLDG